MENQENFRVINKIEKKVIIESLSQISHNIFTTLEEEGFTIFISFNELGEKFPVPLLFLVPSNLLKIIEKLELKSTIISAGVYFGFIKKNRFLLSLEGVEFLKNFNSFSKRHLVIVNNDGEKAILYGNKILKKMITQLSNEVKKNDFLLILNERSELISIAHSQVEFEEIQDLNNNEMIAFNLTDKGYYLRKKQ